MENNKSKDIEVTGVTQVTENKPVYANLKASFNELEKQIRQQGVTKKTLTAWKEQNQKIKKQNLLTEEECRQLDALQTKVVENWIKEIGI